MTVDLENPGADFEALVRFLVEPFLDQPDQLRLHCEQRGQPKRQIIRAAMAPDDRGKIMGRGGRTLQALRQVLAAAAEANNQRVSLDIYGSGAPESGDRPRRGRNSSPRRGR